MHDVSPELGAGSLKNPGPGATHHRPTCHSNHAGSIISDTRVFVEKQGEGSSEQDSADPGSLADAVASEGIPVQPFGLNPALSGTKGRRAKPWLPGIRSVV